MITELIISQEVPAGTEVASSMVPASGKKTVINIFQGSAAYNPNAVCKLVWKFGSGSETVLWTVKGESQLPTKIELPIGEIDGVNVLAITLDNGNSGNLFMSAYAVIVSED